MYQGIEIADYILNYAEQCNYQITNLRLQKILYYIQLNFLKQYDHVIFEDDILAMRHGPCIQSVYDRYHIWGRHSIIKRDHDAFQLKEKEEVLIKRVVDACMLLPEYELADRSQKENGPWYQTFFVNREEVIPVECMRKYVRE